MPPYPATCVAHWCRHVRPESPQGSVVARRGGGFLDKVRVEKAASDGGDQGSILRLAAIEEPTLWAGISTVPSGAATGWHHHGTNTTVLYMLAGTLTVEHGDEPSRPQQLPRATSSSFPQGWSIVKWLPPTRTFRQLSSGSVTAAVHWLSTSRGNRTPASKCADLCGLFTRAGRMPR